MTNATDTLNTSAPLIATRVDESRQPPITIFDTWRLVRPVLQAQIDDFSTDDPGDTILNGLVERFGQLELAMLTHPAATLEDVTLKLESFFTGDDEWCHGREVKDAILADFRRLSLSGTRCGNQLAN